MTPSHWQQNTEINNSLPDEPLLFENWFGDVTRSRTEIQDNWVRVASSAEPEICVFKFFYEKDRFGLSKYSRT